MSDKRLRIAGSSLLGVFARCTEEIALLPLEASQETVQLVEEALEVKAIRIVLGGTSVIGSLACGNSRGFVVANHVGDDALEVLREHGRAARLPAKINAAGNIILANDKAALVHPGLSKKARDVIAETLEVEVMKGTVGGLKTVGMAAVATNQGILVHPRTSEAEQKVLGDLFGLPVDVGTVNFSSPLVGSGILANSKGYLAGADTTGPELGRINEALGFLK